MPLQDLDEIVVYRSDEKAIVPLATVEGAVKHPATFRLGDGMRVSDLLFAAGGVLQEASEGIAHLYRRVGPNDFQIIRIAPKEALAGNPEANLVLQDEDRLVIYRQKEVEPLRQGDGRRRAAAPGELTVYQDDAHDLILLAGGPPTRPPAPWGGHPVTNGDAKERAEVKTFPLEEVMGGKHREEPVVAGCSSRCRGAPTG